MKLSTETIYLDSFIKKPIFAFSSPLHTREVWAMGYHLYFKDGQMQVWL